MTLWNNCRSANTKNDHILVQGLFWNFSIMDKEPQWQLRLNHGLKMCQCAEMRLSNEENCGIIKNHAYGNITINKQQCFCYRPIEVIALSFLLISKLRHAVINIQVIVTWVRLVDRILRELLMYMVLIMYVNFYSTKISVRMLCISHHKLCYASTISSIFTSYFLSSW